MKQLYLRLPDELHEYLVKLAERERRSLNAQIVYLLEQATQQPDKPPPVKPQEE
jgi:hypothetical protein